MVTEDWGASYRFDREDTCIYQRINAIGPVLAEPSRCIQVTEGADGQGLRLWVATDTDIEGYGLGRMEPAAPLL